MATKTSTTSKVKTKRPPKSKRVHTRRLKQVARKAGTAPA